MPASKAFFFALSAFVLCFCHKKLYLLLIYSHVHMTITMEEKNLKILMREIVNVVTMKKLKRQRESSAIGYFFVLHDVLGCIIV